jgi:hypothetical protein
MLHLQTVFGIYEIVTGFITYRIMEF